MTKQNKPRVEKWEAKLVIKSLPDRREIKPIGRITLFGKELTLKETKNYLKAL